MNIQDLQQKAVGYVKQNQSGLVKACAGAVALSTALTTASLAGSTLGGFFSSGRQDDTYPIVNLLNGAASYMMYTLRLMSVSVALKVSEDIVSTHAPVLLAVAQEKVDLAVEQVETMLGHNADKSLAPVKND